MWNIVLELHYSGCISKMQNSCWAISIFSMNPRCSSDLMLLSLHRKTFQIILQSSSQAVFNRQYFHLHQKLEVNGPQRSKDSGMMRFIFLLVSIWIVKIFYICKRDLHKTSRDGPNNPLGLQSMTCPQLHSYFITQSFNSHFV